MIHMKIKRLLESIFKSLNHDIYGLVQKHANTIVSKIIMEFPKINCGFSCKNIFE